MSGRQQRVRVTARVSPMSALTGTTVTQASGVLVGEARAVYSIRKESITGRLRAVPP